MLCIPSNIPSLNWNVNVIWFSPKLNDSRKLIVSLVDIFLFFDDYKYEYRVCECFLKEKYYIYTLNRNISGTPQYIYIVDRVIRINVHVELTNYPSPPVKLIYNLLNNLHLQL